MNGAYLPHASHKRPASRIPKIPTMPQFQTRPDFTKSLDAIVGTRGREATRQISRPYEFQLIGAITKRPN